MQKRYMEGNKRNEFMAAQMAFLCGFFEDGKGAGRERNLVKAVEIRYNKEKTKGAGNHEGNQNHRDRKYKNRTCAG